MPNRTILQLLSTLLDRRRPCGALVSTANLVATSGGDCHVLRVGRRICRVRVILNKDGS